MAPVRSRPIPNSENVQIQNHKKRLVVLENELEKTTQYSTIFKAKLAEIDSKSQEKEDELKKVKSSLMGCEMALEDQIKTNISVAAKNAQLKEKVRKYKDIRMQDQKRIDALEAEVNRLKIENLRLQIEKTKADALIEKYQREIDLLKNTVAQHNTLIGKIRKDKEAEVIERLNPHLRPAIYNKVVEFLKMPQTILGAEFEQILNTDEGQTPSQAAAKFVDAHPEMKKLDVSDQFEQEVMEIIKNKGGVGRYEELSRRWNSVGVAEDVQVQINFRECLVSKWVLPGLLQKIFLTGILHYFILSMSTREKHWKRSRAK